MSLSDDSCCNKTKAFGELLLLSHIRQSLSFLPPIIPLDFTNFARTALQPAVAEIKFFKHVSFLQLES